jgi:hypothetical protein
MLTPMYSDDTMTRMDRVLRMVQPDPPLSTSRPVLVQEYPIRFEDTCCGQCPGSCYVDQMTGA